MYPIYFIAIGNVIGQEKNYFTHLHAISKDEIF